jgi:hypothetical protein
MGRKILAVIVAMITGLAVIWLGWMISTLAAFSTPSQMEHVGQSDLNQYAASAPPMTYIIGLISYALAGFAAGFVVSKMASRWTTGGYGLSILVGVLLTIWAVIAYFRFPGPVWFLIAAIVIFVPSALIAHRMAEGKSHPHVPEPESGIG